MRTNAFDARVLSLERGHLGLEAGPLRIVAPPWKGLKAGDRCRISVDPNDILLCDRPPGRISARNVIETRVRSVRSSDHGESVTLAVPLVARVTPAACRELALAPGAAVWAIFKAWSVRLESGSVRKIPFEVRVGVRGIGQERLEFLEEIDRTGSISAAGRAAGVTYRSAWLWVHGMNSAWGRPLVARLHGGRGGGGAALTAEGRRLLRRFRELRDRLRLSGPI